MSGEGFYDERETNVVAGFYEVEIEEADASVFKQSQKKCMRAYFRVLSGELAGEGFEEMMPVFKVLAFAKAMGRTVTKDSPIFAEDLRGQRFLIEVRMEEYQGRTNPRAMPGGIKLLRSGPRSEPSTPFG